MDIDKLKQLPQYRFPFTWDNLVAELGNADELHITVFNNGSDSFICFGRTENIPELHFWGGLEVIYWEAMRRSNFCSFDVKRRVYKDPIAEFKDFAHRHDISCDSCTNYGTFSDLEPEHVVCWKNCTPVTVRPTDFCSDFIYRKHV